MDSSIEDKSTVKGECASKYDREDFIQKIIGSFGCYQLGLFLVLCFSKTIVAYNQMAIIFLAPKVSYICGANGTETCPCPDPIYDTSLFSKTIVTEWNLICDRKWLISLTQMLYQFGVLLGSLLYGMCSDRFGRKTPLLAAVILKISAGVIASFAPNYWVFTFLRFLVGTSDGGTLVICYVVLMEFVGLQYRDIMTVMFQIPFTLGHMALAALGYFFRDFSELQLAISISAMLMLSYFVVVMESPRWLVAVKRSDEAIHILERVAKINNRQTDNVKGEVDAYQTTIEQNQLKKRNILDLFRTPNLRKHIIAMSINWLAMSYCFYGVSQYVGQLSGNVFVNVLLSASITCLGSIIAIPMIKVIGRRTIFIFFNFLCTACLLILAVIPDGMSSVVLASIGVVSSFMVFTVAYLYCTELFPTVVRNAAVGFCSMSARVGSMVAPFVIDLQSVAHWMPPVAFAILPLIAGCVTFLLPETKGCELMATIEEGEKFETKSKYINNENRNKL